MTVKKPHKKKLVGFVVSDAMDKTIVVDVSRRVKHPVFKKIITVSKRYKAHDENNRYKVGDKVQIIESRPLSRSKCWRVDSSFNAEVK